MQGAQLLSGRVLDSRPRGREFEPHRRHCVVFLSKNINPSLILVQPRKTRPFITERLLMGRKESNQTNKTLSALGISSIMHATVSLIQNFQYRNFTNLYLAFFYGTLANRAESDQPPQLAASDQVLQCLLKECT